jgi:hypothetical protein
MSAELISQDFAKVPAAVAAIVPLQFHQEFHERTTAEQRERIGLLLQIFDEMKTAPEGLVNASKRLALQHSGYGFSAGTLQRHYYAYKSTKDWRCLVPRWRGPQKLPAAFIEYFRMRVEQNKRSTSARSVMVDIRSEWAAGNAFPGYGTWREYFLTEYPDRDLPARCPLGFFPKGWGQSNLYTKQSSKAQRALKRGGFAAAKRYLPHLIRDMSQLRFLELIIIDDFETDIVVMARNPETGRYELCTCTGLLAIDGATRTKVGFGLKPRFKTEEGKRIAITRSDVQGLLYSVFSEHGLPADYGVTILCENAAAAISPDFELALQMLLGVQVARTGLLADKTLKNGFVEKGGKPWQKGQIESTFNLVHNAAGALPGQKGASYQLMPGDHEAQVLFAMKLLSTEGITDEDVKLLSPSFLTFDAALTAYESILSKVQHRTKHSLQGFDEVVEFRLPDGSEIVSKATLDSLGFDKDQVLACTPEPRMESPFERKARLTAGQRFFKPAEHALALLLLTPKKVTFEKHRITFTHQGKGYTYADADSPVMQLAEGTALLGYFDGSDAGKLYVTDLEGRYVGPIKHRGPIDIRDHAAIAAEAGEITRLITKHVINPLRERHKDEDAALLAMRQQGEAVLARLVPQAIPNTPEKKGVSAKLGRTHEPARDCFAPAVRADALAQGIASDATVQTASKATAKALQRAEELDADSLL